MGLRLGRGGAAHVYGTWVWRVAKVVQLLSLSSSRLAAALDRQRRADGALEQLATCLTSLPAPRRRLPCTRREPTWRVARPTFNVLVLAACRVLWESRSRGTSRSRGRSDEAVKVPGNNSPTRYCSKSELFV